MGFVGPGKAAAGTLVGGGPHFEAGSEVVVRVCRLVINKSTRSQSNVMCVVEEEGAHESRVVAAEGAELVEISHEAAVTVEVNSVED